jgi:hypothetical protein
MPFIIEANNNNYNYDNYQDIPQDMYSNINALKCSNCDLDNIDFIANFVNLKKLNASFNKIKQIPLLINLEELDIYNNELIELPIMINLKKLYAFNNKLESIPFLPNLETIDVTHNNISKISLGEKIIYIYVGFNQINQIELLNTKVLDIECNNNLLTNINFIHGLDKLIKFSYYDNFVSYEPPYVKRFLPKNKHEKIINNSIHVIDNNVKKYILKLLDKKPNMNYKLIECDILNNNILSAASKKNLLMCLNAKHILEPTLKITMLELFLNLWTEIKKKNDFDKLDKILISNQCKCITCIFNYTAIL